MDGEIMERRVRLVVFVSIIIVVVMPYVRKERNVCRTRE